jgi:hypothetical protein
MVMNDKLPPDHKYAPAGDYNVSSQDGTLKRLARFEWYKFSKTSFWEAVRIRD